MDDRAQAPRRGLLAILTCLQVYVIVGGLLSFIGWAANVPRLTDWYANGISIQPNTTIAVMSSGIGLALLTWGRRRLAAGVGAFVALIGATVLLQHFSGVNLGIDSPLTFGRAWGRTGVLSAGRMGPTGATSWTLIGIGLVLASFPRGSAYRRWAATIGVITASISALGLIGYLYGSSTLYSLPRSTVIALQTASFIFAVSLGLVLSLPERGLMRVLSDTGAGGVLARRIIPFIVLVPIFIGAVRLHGERMGLYDTAFGSALRTVVEIVLFMVLLWWTGAAINRHAKQRERADRASRASQQRVLGILESITDAFVSFDREWRFTYVNAEAEHLLRKNRSELLGRVVWDVYPEAKGRAAYKELHRVAAERVSTTFEVFNPATERWFFNKAYPTSDGAVVVYFDDVTERKKAEEELNRSRAQIDAELNDTRLLQDISTELIVQEDSAEFYASILDAAVRITRSDFASMQILVPERGASGELQLLAHRGFTPEAATFWEWVSADSQCVCGTALRIGERVIVPDVDASDILSREYQEGYRKAGILAMQSTPLVSRTGTTLGMISTHWREPHEPLERELQLIDILARLAADLIERKRSKETIAALNTQLSVDLAAMTRARSDAERAARLKDEFLATLSHELRTPLNAVIGWSQILKRDLTDPDKVRAVEVIERNGRLQAQLITDLLDISRVISGKMRLDIRPVALQSVIDAAVDSIMPAADAKGVRIEQTLEKVPAMPGDSARLQQVVWNLLSNGVKFTSRGGLVRVTLARAGALVEIRVSDTGEGIPADFVPHIFQRFRQADASVSRAHGGLGLGLALVKELVEFHGGTVRAASEGVGKGSTFVIQLPLATIGSGEEENPLPVPEAGEEAADAYASVPLTGVRVLLVDDDADALAMMRRVLEDSKAIVRTASSAVAALEVLRRESFDVIVSDIAMPNGDGYELISEVRTRGIETPALAVTALARAEDRRKAMSSGYQAHVAKPVETEELLGTVASLIAR